MDHTWTKYRLWTSRFFQRYKTRLHGLNNQLSFLSAILLIFFITGDQSHQIHQRRLMVSEIEMTALVTGLHTGLYSIDKKVLSAMSRIPRDHFIDHKYASYAYKNVALPVEQEHYLFPEPFLTAMMIHLMNIDTKDQVLEVGYGTGYETAILSKLANAVYSVRHTGPVIEKYSKKETPSPALDTKTARAPNVYTKTSNGLFGWSGVGQFDAILVKQAVKYPPPMLLKQLKINGRMVIPIENEYGEQRVHVYIKKPSGNITTHETLHVKMTHLVRGEEI